MSKRIVLFLLTNFAILITLGVLWQVIELVVGQTLPQGSLVMLGLFCLVWGMGGAFLSLALSRWMAKRAMGVKLIDGHTGQPPLDDLHATVMQLAREARLPAMPEVGIYQSDEVNAFATGPSASRALVAVSTGLLRSMPPNDVKAVLGHEITHVANGDMVTMTLIQGVVNAFVMFVARVLGVLAASHVGRRNAWVVRFVVTMGCQVLFGILGSLVVAWFSRQREFRADRGGASLAGRDNMVAALESLQARKDLIDASEPALAALKISGKPSRFLAAFSTHPPLPVRIARLRELAG